MKQNFTLKRVLLLFACVYVGLVFLVGFLGQDYLLFPSEPLGENHEFSAYREGVEVQLLSDDFNLINALYFHSFPGAKVVLYLHGNAGNLENWRYEYEEFYKHGLNLLMIDYRSYGKSEGEISEKGLYLDVESAYEYLKNNGYKARDVIVYGRSLGSGLAVYLAQNKQIHALALESPYSSLKGFIQSDYWFMLPWLYLNYEINSCEMIKKVHAPLYILHGEKDEVIPLQEAERLYDCANEPKQMQRVPKAMHNNLSEFSQKEDFIRLLK